MPVTAYNMLTPAAIEKRLLALDTAVTEVITEANRAERIYADAKAAHELAMARARLSLAESGTKMTVGERDDRALLDCEDTYVALAEADAIAKASRNNVTRVRVQSDLIRSLGAGLRAAMDIG